MSPSQDGRPPDRGLEIPCDPDWQERAWRLERIGWWGFVLIIALAMSGLFGDGPLSRQTAATADGRMAVRYPWIVRRQAETLIRLRLQPSPAERFISVWLERPLLDMAELDEVVPDPLRMVADGQGVTMMFERRPGPEPMHVLLHVRVRGPGRHAGVIRLDDGEPLELRHWVLP